MYNRPNQVEEDARGLSSEAIAALKSIKGGAKVREAIDFVISPYSAVEMSGSGGSVHDGHKSDSDKSGQPDEDGVTTIVVAGIVVAVALTAAVIYARKKK
mmetsp:Transcript_25731/g.64816  ORF Transcript_25731/g.64816 Transcript_25731/m.64816 type:complete len:100 (-) Transcript_25731:314-613(-)